MSRSYQPVLVRLPWGLPAWRAAGADVFRSAQPSSDSGSTCICVPTVGCVRHRGDKRRSQITGSSQVSSSMTPASFRPRVWKGLLRPDLNRCIGFVHASCSGEDRRWCEVQQTCVSQRRCAWNAGIIAAELPHCRKSCCGSPEQRLRFDRCLHPLPAPTLANAF